MTYSISLPVGNIYGVAVTILSRQKGSNTSPRKNLSRLSDMLKFSLSPIYSLCIFSPGSFLRLMRYQCIPAVKANNILYYQDHGQQITRSHYCFLLSIFQTTFRVLCTFLGSPIKEICWWAGGSSAEGHQGGYGIGALVQWERPQEWALFGMKKGRFWGYILASCQCL